MTDIAVASQHVIPVDVMEAVAPIGSIRKRDVGTVRKTAVTSIATIPVVNICQGVGSPDQDRDRGE
ncbi:MAG: hypothetical protein QNK31_05270 [Porticoccus sp.]|nr:hypothetical protein [Porticoccus sp.]